MGRALRCWGRAQCHPWHMDTDVWLSRSDGKGEMQILGWGQSSRCVVGLIWQNAFLNPIL